MKKRTKGILIGGAILLAAAAVITGAVVGGVVTSKQKRENAKNNNNSNQDHNTEKPVFEPNISLLKASYDSLNFRIDNLKSKDFSGKNIKVKLVNTLPGSNQSFEKTYSISKDDVELLFDNLTDGSKYKVSVVFEDKEMIAKEFETLLRPKISEGSKTSTNAVLNLSDLDRLSNEELKNVEIVITNKTDKTKPAIKVPLTEISIVGGRARVDLQELDLGLEPGTSYEVVVKQKSAEGSNEESLSQPLEFKTHEVTNVAYSFNKSLQEVTIFGLKQNDKKIELEYKPANTNINFTKVVSTKNVENNKVIVKIEEFLGFDNSYEFKVKYVDDQDYLTFEDNTKSGEFRTDSAPKISVENSEGLKIKLDNISKNIEEDKIYVRYKDKEGNEWKEVLLSTVKDQDTGEIKLPNLAPDTEYETQLIYKKSADENATPIILSIVDFTTQKDLEFAINKSIISSNKVILKFNDNIFDANDVGADNNYKNIKIKYLKLGQTQTTDVLLSKEEVNGKVFAKAEISSLEKNTKYVWSLVYNDSETLFSGEFKTNNHLEQNKTADSLNAYEQKETEDVAVEDTLVNGILVSVKNNFGYIKDQDSTFFNPQKISIKYYPKEDETQALTKEIFITPYDLNEKTLFTKLIDDVNDDNYVFEVSYNHGFDSKNNLINVKKTFEIGYKLPNINFVNEGSKIVITNLEGLNNKEVSIEYRQGSGNVISKTGTVTNGQIEFVLSDLKSNSLYNLDLVVPSESITFKSSIENETRAQFYGLDSTSDSKIKINTSFETQEQPATILFKGESGSSVTRKMDINVGIEGFKEHPNKDMKLVFVKKTQYEAYIANKEDSSVEKIEVEFRTDANGTWNDRWLKNFDLNTEYKAILFDRSNSNNLVEVKVIDYTTPDLPAPYVQNIDIIGSNTDDPKIKFENVQALFETLPNGYDVRVGFRKIGTDKPYKEFTSPNLESNFDFGAEFPRNWTKNLSTFGKKDQRESKVLRIYDLFQGDHADYRTWFEDRQSYQIIVYFEKNGNKYVVASNKENKLIYFNYTAPAFVESETTNAIAKKEGTQNEYVASISYKLNNLWQYVSNSSAPSPEGANASENPQAQPGVSTTSGEVTNSEVASTPTNVLKAYYIKSNDVLAALDPTNWTFKGNVSVNDADQTGTLTFDNLELNTFYNFAFLDKDNNIILSKQRVKTSGKPKLRNTTYGDTIMRYTLSNLNGSQSIFVNDTYKIVFSRDKSYGSSSNEFVVDGTTNLKNLDPTVVFTLNDLLPNTTYNYKLVNAVGQTMLGYEGIFKTNESQSADKIVGTNHAVVNLKNPSFKLREGNYSIAKKDSTDETKMVLDVLRFQYSTSENFDEQSLKEFSVSLSENESQLLPIRVDGLEPNTKYFYRLLSGTIKSNVIKNTREDSDNSAPVISLDTNNPVILGSFTTLPIMNEGTSTNNSAKLVFAKPSNVNGNDELFLRYKRVDSSKEYLVEYNYVIDNNKVIFDVQNLNSNNYYEYLLSGNDYTEYSRGEFSTKDNNSLKVRLMKVGEFLRRIEIDNADSYAGQKVRISLKKSSDANYNSVDVVITPENNKFIWDLDDFEELKNYNYKVELLNNANEVVHLLQEGNIEIERPYAAGDQKVTTNVRTFGNYDLNKWYTITNLQEIYANAKNWKQKVKDSLQEIAIFGTEVSSGSAYAWHNLIHESNRKQYAEETTEGLVYSYLFNDNGKLKGIKFELRLIGNMIQVRIIEAKAKNESIDPILLVDRFNYSDLNESIVYKATGGAINQGTPNILGNKFINISGFKFKAQRSRIGSKDYSIPQIFRYSVEEAAVALNELTPSVNNNSTGAFVNLNNPKQKEKYGTFGDEIHNYNVGYNAYIAKENKLLPFNANFLVSTSAYPGFALNNSNISVPGFNGNDDELRNKFFKTLLESGKIRFTGSDTKNKNWIAFNSPDVLLFDDEEYAYSQKYEMELPVKRLIWKDGNTIKGIRIALNDAKNGNGAVLGQFDDFVYVKEIASNETLENITWSKFIETASKQTTSNYMNPNSPGSAIGGISFVSREKMFIDNSYRKYNNFSSDNLAPKFLYEANVVDETTTTRIVKISNYDVGTYKIKVQYLTYFGKLTSEQISNEQEVVINDDNKSLVSVDLSEKLKYNGKYRISLLNSQNEEINSATGDNYQSTSGVFIIPDITNLNSGANPGENTLAATSGWLGYYVDRLFGFEPANYSKWYEKTKETLKYGLIGSTKFNDSPDVSRKWAKAIYKGDLDHPDYPNRPIFLFAALNDDNTKVIITELLLEPTDGNANNIISVYSGAKLFTLGESDPKSLDDMSAEWIKNKFNSSGATNLEKVRVLSSSSHENRTALLGLYFENPRPAETTVENAQPDSAGSAAGSQ